MPTQTYYTHTHTDAKVLDTRYIMYHSRPPQGVCVFILSVKFVQLDAARSMLTVHALLYTQTPYYFFRYAQVRVHAFVINTSAPLVEELCSVYDHTVHTYIRCM